ncbi:MAG: hypothetical protein RIC92_18130, partial [Roseovarius sp.]|uniref:hypothetical protein n=1 Tax=Roseovarius sp. TaxID=1486281 RepID=UPI0032EFD798
DPVMPIDPHHSRPLDVHRWSDHPEVNALVGEVWDEVFGEEEGVRPGPKPKARPRDMLKVILLDLYVAWTTDPDLSIGVNLNLKKWVPGSRYNALHLSRAVPDQIHRLAEAGLIELSMGSYSGPGASTNRTSRIRAAEPLRAKFREARFGRIDVGHNPDRECIILRDEGGREQEYEDTDATREMREELRAYNDLLARTFIDLPNVDDPFIEREVTTGPREGQRTKVPFFPGNKFVRRVFSRGDWGLNGRFYGGWWQQIGAELRKKIHINGVPTVERDFKALHINILSLERGVPLEDDPYDLTDGFLEGVDRRAQRKYLKTLVLTAINASNEGAAYQAFRDSYPAGDPAKRFRNDALQHLLEEFVRRTPQLEGELFADQGIRLMNVDARIAEGVIRGAAGLNLPVLSVHDSFIVDYRQAMLLTKLMKKASTHVAGRPLPTSADWMGLDEVPEDRRDEYADVRRIEPTRGSIERRTMFEDVVGPIEAA